jgi:hypothetical protein
MNLRFRGGFWMLDTTILLSSLHFSVFCEEAYGLWVPIIHEACSCIKSIMMHLQ